MINVVGNLIQRYFLHVFLFCLFIFQSGFSFASELQKIDNNTNYRFFSPEHFLVSYFYFNNKKINAKIEIYFEMKSNVDRKNVNLRPFVEEISHWIPKEISPLRYDATVIIGGDRSLAYLRKFFSNTLMASEHESLWQGVSALCAPGSNNSGFTRGFIAFVRICANDFFAKNKNLVLSTIYHELFHIYQNTLISRGGLITTQDPFWITEGSALFFELSASSGNRFSRIIANMRDSAAEKTMLHQFMSGENQSSKPEPYDIREAINFIPILYDITSYGTNLESVSNFYIALGQGAPWRDAIVKSFDLSRHSASPE